MKFNIGDKVKFLGIKHELPGFPQDDNKYKELTPGITLIITALNAGETGQMYTTRLENDEEYCYLLWEDELEYGK